MSKRLSTTKDINGTAASSPFNVPLFRFFGIVRVLGVWGQVKTVLGSNVTAAGLRMNDQTAQDQITSAAGTTISAAPVGSQLCRDNIKTSALSYKSAASVTVDDPSGQGLKEMTEFVVTAKPGVANDLEFHYATTDAPTSGQIKFYIEWEPLSDDGAVLAL